VELLTTRVVARGGKKTLGANTKICRLANDPITRLLTEILTPLEVCKHFCEEGNRFVFENKNAVERYVVGMPKRRQKHIMKITLVWTGIQLADTHLQRY
jgi:hypothetical protein